MTTQTTEIIDQLTESYNFDFSSATDEEIIAEVARRLLKSGSSIRPEIANAIASAGLAQWNREREAYQVAAEEAYLIAQQEMCNPLG